MSEPPATSSRPRPGLRALAVAAGAMAVVFAAILSYWENAGTPTTREREVARSRYTWAAKAQDGVVYGHAERITPVPGSGAGPSAGYDLVFDPIANRLLAADVTGRMRALRVDRAPDAEQAVKALLTGVAPLPDGRLALCLGRSGFGVDYSVVVLDPEEPPKAETRVAIGFCTTVLAAGDGRIYYATKNARVAGITLDGRETWKAVFPQVPTTLALSTEGELAVGDERGGLTWCREDGTVLRTREVGGFPVTALAFLGTRALVAVDGAGVASVFDEDGRLLRRFKLGAGATRIRAIVARGQEVDFISDTGHVFEVQGIEPLPALSQTARENLRWLGAAGLMLLALGLGVASSARVMTALRLTLGRAVAGRIAYALVLPTFVLLAVFSYYPMVTALGYSFGNFSLTAPWEFAGLKNFRTMLEDPYLAKSVVNMLVLLGTGLVKMIVLPLLAAELVFWLPSERWQQFFRSAVIFPAVVPGVVVVLVWKMIYDPYAGLINVSLRALGWEGATHAWLGEERFALWSVVFYNFPWINLLIFLIFLGGLIQIDRSLFEAGDMDGATRWQRFWHIDLPALRPKLNIAVTLIVIWSVQDFASVLILTGGGPGTATYVPALQMFLQISDGHNLGYSSAVGLALFLVVLAFTLVSRRLNREEEM